MAQKVVGHSRLIDLQQQAANRRMRNGFESPAFEQDYALWLRIHSAPMRRWLMAVPFFAMVLAPVYCTLMLHTYSTELIWLGVIGLGITAPLCAFSIILLYRNPTSALTTRMLLVSAIVVFWAAALIRWLSVQEEGKPLSPEIVMIGPVALAALARLRLFLILPTIVGCSTLFLVMEWFINGTQGYGPTLLGTLLFTSVSIIIAFATDHLARQAWLAEQIMELTAMSDAVTGLPNRQWLNRDMGTLFALARREHQPLAVYLIDLDHFKKLNDSHGHAAGDEALKAVGALLALFGRRALDLAGRYGGEEFVLVLHDPKLYGTVRIGNQLVSRISALGIENNGAPLGYLTASVGVYTAIPGAKDRFEDFLHEADLALYAAKHLGRNRMVLRQPQDAARAVPASDDDAIETAIPAT
ncbi:MAG: GGDEF domain-containing protein [Stagnimonas sp.]|nr:GGDEF domain-containing protein [Stagnimonas sp.]